MVGKSEVPTATTYAILGLLAAGPQSAYDLAERMEIGYGVYWPRARSHVFTETKKIARLGWATGRERARGARTRTEYRITAAGRAALRTWLSSAPITFALDNEHLVRVYLAAFGTTADLVAVLNDARQRAAVMLGIADRVIGEYETGQIDGPQDEPQFRVLLVDFLASYARMTADWAERSLEEIGRWEGNDPDTRREQAVARMSKLPRRRAVR